jgi:hypothetical protein
MWRSLVAHLTGGQGVAGSNPVIPTYRTAGQSGCRHSGGARSSVCDTNHDSKAVVAARGRWRPRGPGHRADSQDARQVPGRKCGCEGGHAIAAATSGGHTSDDHGDRGTGSSETQLRRNPKREEFRAWSDRCIHGQGGSKGSLRSSGSRHGRDHCRHGRTDTVAVAPVGSGPPPEASEWACQCPSLSRQS